MTQVSSTKKDKSFANAAMRHNFCYNVRDNMKLMIVIFVLHFAAVPMLLITALADIFSKGSTETIDEGFMVTAVIGTGLAAASGMLCALTVFKYLYNKSAVDMRLSLPMTTGQRFASDFLSGLFVYIIPYFAAELISWLLMLAGHILCDGKTFTYTTEHPSIPGKMLSYDWVCTIFEDTAPVLWRGMLGGLMLMVMFYAVTVLAAACCGNIFEAAAYNILLNALVPVSVLLGITTVCNNIYGLDEEIYGLRILPFCGPFGGAYGVIASLEPMIEESNGYIRTNLYEPLHFGTWFILFTLCTALVIAGAYLIYRKRKAEDTGKPVVFGIFHHIIMTMGIFSLCYLMMMDGTENYMPIIIISFIIYMVMHVIRNRGFGKIISGLVICTFTILGSIGSFLVIHNTKAFGAGDVIPDPQKVKKAEITYAGCLNSDYIEYAPAELTDPALIETLTELHSEILRVYNDNVSNGELTDLQLPMGFCVKYTLSSGRTIYRSYGSSFSDKGVELICSLDMAEGVKKSRAEGMKRTILDIRDTLEYREEYDKSFDKNNVYVKLSPQWRFSSGGQDYDGSYSIGINELPEDFIERLADCMYSDIMSQTSGEYYTPTGNIYQIEIFETRTFFIRDSYQNTLSFLASCGFKELPVVTEEGVSRILRAYENRSGSFSVISNPLIGYMTGRDIGNVNPPVYNGNAGYFKYKNGWIFSQCFSSAYEYYDDIYTLFTHSYKAYKTDESCYTITAGGNSAVIPSEYSDIAERVFIRMTADKANHMNERGFWSSPYEYDNTTGEQYRGYSEYLRAFLEFYGRDKIISALSFYYDSETAEKTYADLTEWSKTNTDFYDQFGDTDSEITTEEPEIYPDYTEAYEVYEDYYVAG
ncbi:MAG: hypothetical protein MSJ26_02205 [Oscillospiraceae bacterium]|nr:hypothetical protein [Oscillospiraceae bacterium]